VLDYQRMTARFDRWTALTVSALGTVLWAVLPVLRGDGGPEDSLWRALDSATELQLNARDPR
jgi:hypothetical protein